MNRFIDWLKTSIPGIILLGAVGSLLAAGMVAAARKPFRLFFNWLWRVHRRIFVRQADFAAFAARVIEADDTTKLGASFLIFKLARFLAAMMASSTSLIVLVLLMEIRGADQLFVTPATLCGIVFITFYWAWYEYEWLHGVYLILWKDFLVRAESDLASSEPVLGRDEMSERAGNGS